jgi:hypothetical protein
MEATMKNRFLAGLALGIILGALGLFAGSRLANRSSAAVPPVVNQATPQNLPPHATPHHFNGGEYYVVPLS